MTDTNSSDSNLDWTAFHSLSPPIARNPCSPLWLSLQEDAVAPNDQLALISTSNDNAMYLRNEPVFNGLNQQSEVQAPHHTGDNVIESIYANNSVPNQMTDVKEHVDTLVC